MLNRNADAPALYLQLVQFFRNRFASGEWPPKCQIPTELELASTYAVSRNTIRQALNILVQDGLLERTQGRGTFVRAPIALSDLPSRLPSRAPTCEKRIGVVLSHAGDQLNMEILIGVEQACRSRGYELSFSYSNDNGELQQRDVARLRASGVCGFILFPLSDEEESQAIAQLHADGLPLVLVDRYLPTLSTDYVGVDNVNGGYRAAEHLLILGHRRIGFAHQRIGGLTTSSVRERWQGYRQALEGYGQPYDEALLFNTADARVFTGPQGPTSVFAVNDEAAMDILKVARVLGLRVPEDLAVVGFDDLTFAAMTQPPLTTVAQPRVEVGVRAGHLLIDRIEGLASAPRHIVLPTHLVVRESCGAKVHIRDGMRIGA